MSTGLWNSIKREVGIMCRRPVYLIMMIMVPLGCVLFFLWMMSPGLPVRVPSAVVDLDHSQMSRQVTQNLVTTELVDIQYSLESYSSAMDKVREGKIYGFFLIPENFEKDAVAGNTPTLNYFCNLTFFIPGSLSFKEYKVVSVTTAGGVAQAKLVSKGVPGALVSELAQPFILDTQAIGNPWLNYSYYLTPSFSFAMYALIIMLFTCFTITSEIKYKTSPQWLQTAHGSMLIALLGKLLPQTAVFIVSTFAALALMFGFNGFPMNGSLGWLLLATVLFIGASQSFAVFITCLLPNPRLSMSVVSLLGVLTFSFAGFSFPVEKMYGYIAIFSYIVPVRYWFLIYVNNALNGFDVYYVRYLFAALCVFPLVAMTMMWKLKKACLHPVYVP